MVDIDGLNGRALVILLVVGGVMATGVVAASTLTVSSGTTYEAGNGFEVTAGTQFSSSFANPFNGSNQIILNNVTFTSSGDSDLTIDQFTGTYTNLSSIATNSTDIKINPNDKPAINVTGGVTAIDFRDAELDGKTDFVYSASSSGTVVVRGLAGSTKFGAVDSGGSVIDNGTTTASGQATVDLSSATGRSVDLITPLAPEIDEATASPTARINNETQTFEVAVSDADFPSDNLTADFYVDGSLVGSDTLSQSGTASVSHTITTGGTSPWHVEVTDEYNLTTTSDSDVAQTGNQPFTVDVPATLSVRNVSNTSQLVTGSSLEVTFLGDDEVATRKDTNNDGKIDFSGLPLDERFEAEISANGYHTRSIVIPSLFAQEDAYLLNDTKPSVTPRFVIDSAVSDFPERDSEIIIERPLNATTGQRFATITSAEPGVSGLDVVLEEDQRYRLTVRGTSGATRQLGSYRATATEQVTLEIASGQFDVPDTVDGVTFDAGFSQPPAVTATVRDRNIQSASVVVTRRNDSTVILDQTTTGNLSVSTPAKNETQYIVNMTATLQSGKTVSDTQQVSSGQIATGGAIDSQWQQLLAMVLLLIVAGLFTRANAGVGAISTASIGGVFWYIGWLDGLATGLAVVVALLIGILAYAKQKRGGVPT